MKDEPTQEQLNELTQLSKEARAPDESEIVTTKEEAAIILRACRSAEAEIDAQVLDCPS
jgi:hypothetical protein